MAEESLQTFQPGGGITWWKIEGDEAVSTQIVGGRNLECVARDEDTLPYESEMRRKKHGDTPSDTAGRAANAWGAADPGTGKESGPGVRVFRRPVSFLEADDAAGAHPTINEGKLALRGASRRVDHVPCIPSGNERAGGASTCVQGVQEILSINIVK